MAVNYIKNINVEIYPVGHERNPQPYPHLVVSITPNEGEAVEVTPVFRPLTALNAAQIFHAVAAAIEKWGDETGITKDSMEAMAAAGLLHPRDMTIPPHHGTA